jgi:predicted MFS family arabinose efflux permease
VNQGAEPAAAEFRRHWTVVLAAACGAGAGITGMSFYSLGILIGPLTDTFGWSHAEVSAAKTVLTSGFILTAPFVGYVADRLGVRRIAMLSLGLLSLAMFWMTQIGPSLTSFYLSLLVLAVAGGATTPLVWTRAVASWFHQRRGLAMALTLSGTGVIGVITPPLQNALIQRYDWRAAYVCMGVVALLALIPIALFFRENRGTAADASANVPQGDNQALQPGFTVREALHSRVFWQLCGAFFLVGGSVSALSVHLVPLIIEEGLDRGTAAGIASVMGIAVILGRLLTGYLVDRFHPPRVAALFLIAPVLGCLLLLGDHVTMAVVVMAVACIGLAAGSEVDLVPFLTARYFGLKAYGKVYSWIFIAFYTGVGLGPPLLGHMFDRYGNYDLGLTWLIPVLALGVAVVATLGKSPSGRKT